MPFPTPLLQLAMLTIDEATARRLKITTAESCTGGMIAGLLTEVPGSSAVFERSFVTYSNRAKEEMLGVPGDIIADAGAVSEIVARAMAEGALKESRSNIALAVTGIAGPEGGTRMKPVGTVHFALARENTAILHRQGEFLGLDRSEVRLKAVEFGLNMVRETIAAMR